MSSIGSIRLQNILAIKNNNSDRNTSYPVTMKTLKHDTVQFGSAWTKYGEADKEIKKLKNEVIDEYKQLKNLKSGTWFKTRIASLAAHNQPDAVYRAVETMDYEIGLDPQLKPLYQKFFKGVLKQDKNGHYTLLEAVGDEEFLAETYNNGLKKVS